MLSSLPGLTENEFRDACQALQKRCDGRLDNTDWLDIQWRDGVLTIRKSYHISSMETLEVGTKTCESDDLAASLGDVDDGDNQTLTRYPRSCQKTLVVDFSIILSPTYQVPVLWFTPGQHLLDRPWSLDTVYEHLVPNFQQDRLRQVGVLGGISMAYHPVSDLPAFFIHPCNTAVALQDVGVCEDISSEGYLLLWLGLIGTSVNLHVPSKLLLEQKGN